METEGSAGDVVSIPEPVDFSNFLSEPASSSSGVIFNSNGNVYKLNQSGLSSVFVGPWLINGNVSSFTINRTITDGTLSIDPGSGWLALATIRQYSIQSTSSPQSTTVMFEISDDGGVTVLDAVSYVFQLL